MLLRNVLSHFSMAVTKSGTGTWGLGRGRRDVGRGTRGRGDAGTWDVGTRERGTRGRRDVGCGDWGCGGAETLLSYIVMRESP